jgi:CheY-like chemotaxis protein
MGFNRVWHLVRDQGLYQFLRAYSTLVLYPFIIRNDIFALILDSKGYSAEAAHDGESALEICRQRIPDLVLSDVVMPGMNGIELAIAVSQQFRTATSSSFPAKLTPRRYWKTPSAKAMTSNSLQSLFIRRVGNKD